MSLAGCEISGHPFARHCCMTIHTHTQAHTAPFSLPRPRTRTHLLPFLERERKAPFSLVFFLFVHFPHYIHPPNPRQALLGGWSRAARLHAPYERFMINCFPASSRSTIWLRHVVVVVQHFMRYTHTVRDPFYEPSDPSPSHKGAKRREANCKEKLGLRQGLPASVKNCTDSCFLCALPPPNPPQPQYLKCAKRALRWFSVFGVSFAQLILFELFVFFFAPSVTAH